MNEHEASVANKLIDAGNPYVAAVTVYLMQKRDTPKGLGIKRVAVATLSTAAALGTVAKGLGWL